MTIGLVRRLALLCASLAIAVPAATAKYPDRPVTIVAPYGAGGSSDTLARVIAERLNKVLGGNFIVENRPGAGSRVGTESVARGKADGYTLLLADMPYAIVPNVYKNVAYKARDFVAIAQVGLAPIVLFARPDLKGASIESVVKSAKAKKEAVAIGSGGIGATTHMVAELLQKQVGAKLLHVPFGGTGPSLRGLAGGQVDVAFGSYASGRSLTEAGSIRAIGVTSPKRAKILPDVPTFSEKGVDLVVRHWWGLLAPKGTPADVVSSLRKAVASVLDEADVKARLTKLGVSPGELSPAAFQEFLSSENDRWAGIVKSAGIQAKQ